MDDELRKIDIIRERMGLSYREAREALETAGGDLVLALASVEEKTGRRWSDKLVETGEELAGQVKTYIDKGNHTKLKLKRGEKTLAEFPATVGALGVLAALASTPIAIAAGIGAVAAVAKNVTMEVEKPGKDNKVVSLDNHRDQ